VLSIMPPSFGPRLEFEFKEGAQGTRSALFQLEMRGEHLMAIIAMVISGLMTGVALPIPCTNPERSSLPHCLPHQGMPSETFNEYQCFLVHDRQKVSGWDLNKGKALLGEDAPFSHRPWKHGLGAEKDAWKANPYGWAKPGAGDLGGYTFCPRQYRRFCESKFGTSSAYSTTFKQDVNELVNVCVMTYHLLHQGPSNFMYPDVTGGVTYDPYAALTVNEKELFPIDPYEVLTKLTPFDTEAPVHFISGWHTLREQYTQLQMILPVKHMMALCKMNFLDTASGICTKSAPSQNKDKYLPVMKDLVMKVVNDMRLIGVKYLLEQSIEIGGWLPPPSLAGLNPVVDFSMCETVHTPPAFSEDQVFTPSDNCADTRCVAYDAAGSDDVGSDYDVNLKGCREFQVAASYNELFAATYGNFFMQHATSPLESEQKHFAGSTDQIMDTNVYPEDFLGLELKADKTSDYPGTWLNGWYDFLLNGMGGGLITNKAKFHISHLLWSIFKIRMYAGDEDAGSALDYVQPSKLRDYFGTGGVAPDPSGYAARQEAFTGAIKNFWRASNLEFHLNNAILLLKMEDLITPPTDLSAASYKARLEKLRLTPTSEVLRQIYQLKDNGHLTQYKDARNFLFIHAVEINRVLQGDTMQHYITRDHISGFAGGYAVSSVIPSIFSLKSEGVVSNAVSSLLTV
jgi:hypothetical protein